MCTSNVAGNTPMASLGRQVTQNGLGVINAIARGIYNGVVEVTVLGDDERRCCQCRPIPNQSKHLRKRKNRKLKISNDKCQMVAAESGGGVALGNAEVEVMVVDYTRCRS